MTRRTRPALLQTPKSSKQLQVGRVGPEIFAPQPREMLYLYISATTHVASTILVVERKEEGHAYAVQRSVFFISEVLTDSKVQYNQAQKLLYVLLITACKLKHYF
jgi:hypothetical protein